MTRWIARRIPQILIAWLALAALLPRESFLRPLYLINTYACLPLALLAVVWTRRARWRFIRTSLPDVALVVFVGLAGVSMLATRDAGTAIGARLGEFARAFFVPFCAFWLARLGRVGRRDVEAWLPMLAGLCVIEAAVAILALTAPGALPGSIPGYAGEMGGMRVTGTFTQPDACAAYLVWAGALAFLLLADAGDRRQRRAGVLLFVLAFATAFATFSRASWIGGAVAAGVLALAHRRRLIAPALALALVVAALARVPAHAAAVPTLPADTTASSPIASAAPRDASYALDRLQNTRTIYDRLALGAAGLRVFLDSPVFGRGYGTYDLHARAKVTTTGSVEPSDWARLQAASHNTHVSVLAELGLTGYASLVCPVAWVAWRSTRAWREPARDRRLLLTWWAVLSFLGVVTLSIDLRFLAPASGLFWCVLGLAAVESGDPDA